MGWEFTAMNIDKMCLGLAGSIWQWVAEQRQDLTDPPESVLEEVPRMWR